MLFITLIQLIKYFFLKNTRNKMRLHSIFVSNLLSNWTHAILKIKKNYITFANGLGEGYWVKKASHFHLGRRFQIQCPLTHMDYFPSEKIDHGQYETSKIWYNHEQYSIFDSSYLLTNLLIQHLKLTNNSPFMSTRWVKIYGVIFKKD